MKKRIILLVTFLVLFYSFFVNVSFLKAETGNYKGDLWNLINYYRIKRACNYYKDIEKNGGWPFISSGSIYRKGDTDPDIYKIKKRLYLTKDLKELPEKRNKKSEYFGEKLELAVKRFQYRHGLIEDGIVGNRTLAALNVPVAVRIKQLELNSKLIYNLFDVYLKRYLLINIPGFELRVIDDGSQVLKAKVIVGQKENKTPVFNKEMTYLVFNPPWKIPINKTVKDIIPIIKQDPGYLERENIIVFESWEDNARKLDPAHIDWDQFTVDNFDLKLQQKPGPDNELGKVKFMFPNKHLVYIHDTPHKYLFDYKYRAFSSGCIRVQKPIELALYCLQDKPGWNLEKIEEVLNKGETLKVELEEAIPVYIVYWTAWVDDKDLIHFRHDIYERYIE